VFLTLLFFPAYICSADLLEAPYPLLDDLTSQYSSQAAEAYRKIASMLYTFPEEDLEWKTVLEIAPHLSYEKVDFGGDNQLYLVSDKEKPLALFKLNEKIALQQEVLGYQADHLLGLHMTPPTSWLIWQGMEGRLQQFVPHTTTGLQALMDSPLAEALSSIPPHLIHIAAISGFIKGIGAGHYSNYLLAWNGNQVDRIIEIDLEKIFPVQNTTPDGAPMCRMWILGLPAADLPFDQALLSIVTHTAFQQKFAYLDLSPEARMALKERLDKIATFTKMGGGTPRELFFHIYGGKELYEQARIFGYPNVIIFNEILKYKKMDTLCSFDPEQFFKKHLNRNKLIENILKFRL
jgi:hypothetical protein